MRAIDADALKEDLTRFYDNEVTARKLIDEQPTIQPEIIRCKDCKYWVPGYITDNDDFIPPKCGEWQQMVGHSSDDYCSLAEKMDDAISREGTSAWLENMGYSYPAKVIMDKKRFPSVKPEIKPCDYVKACKEVSMNKVTSAYYYLDALDEFKKHGYVLVDMREVAT